MVKFISCKSRFFCVVLLMFFCVALWAGGGQQSSADNAPLTIRFWHAMADDAGQAFDSYVREFNEGPGAEKGIVVEAVFQGQYADATAKLRPLLQARQTAALPDVMQFDATGIVDYLNTEYA
jgi:sn-glycerol 3-phosphate transport system substrate-binding protein